MDVGNPSISASCDIGLDSVTRELRRFLNREILKLEMLKQNK